MKATNIWKSIDFFSSIHLEKTMEGLKNFILSYLLIAISIVPPFWDKSEVIDHGSKNKILLTMNLTNLI
ncbi:unnamed protein product [Lactuca virosa]|uniref:Uncharacterized protein n=1 Tax=Lactuca virosa TaxID=75947 RepID=A0AAU9MJE1_9ASTR|nr:unnamed protein product [Lactuca virosa]